MSTYDEWKSTEPADPWADELKRLERENDEHQEYHGLITIVKGEGEGWTGSFDQFVNDNQFEQDYANRIGEALATVGEFSNAEQWGRWTIRRCDD